MNGEGILRFQDGTKFKGTFVNGERNGKGILVDKDGTRYEGNFENNNKEGVFVVKDKDGNITGKYTYRNNIQISTVE